MGPSSSLTILCLATVTLLVAATSLRLWRGQTRRVERLEGNLLPCPTPPPYRAVALTAVTPPAEDHQPCLAGVPLPGGLMAWPPPLTAAEALAELCLTRRAPSAYLGPEPEVAVLHLGNRALEVGVDPRGRLMVPRDVAELERTLATRALPPPWVVVEGDPDLEGLRRLHQRFGCPILLVGQAVAPPGYQGLSKTHPDLAPIEFPAV